METLTNTYFGNAISVKNFEMKNAENCAEDYQLQTQFQIEGEIISIGSMKAVKPAWFEYLFDMENFPEGQRQYPFLLWSYNDISEYQTEIIYELSEGEKWLELPPNQTFETSFLNYSLVVEKLSDTKAKLTRKITIDKGKLPAEQYEKLRETAKAVIKAEDIYLVY